jgi:hypothetical protein
LIQEPRLKICVICGCFSWSFFAKHVPARGLRQKGLIQRFLRFSQIERMPQVVTLDLPSFDWR